MRSFAQGDDLGPFDLHPIDVDAGEVRQHQFQDSFKPVKLVVTVMEIINDSDVLAVMIFGKWSYRIEASFILKTDDLAYIPAPFDGYIQHVPVQVGDRVEAGAPCSCEVAGSR